MVSGWMVFEAGGDCAESRKYFLDINNAVAYAESQGADRTPLIQKQYIRPEWAEDLHGSRLRRNGGMER